MTERKDGGPAFGHGNPRDEEGMRLILRDWFAGQALPAIITATSAGQYTHHHNSMAHDAYRIADAMLKERDE